MRLKNYLKFDSNDFIDDVRKCRKKYRRNKIISNDEDL